MFSNFCYWGEKKLAQHFMTSLGEDGGFCQILKDTKGKPVIACFIDLTFPALASCSVFLRLLLAVYFLALTTGY